MSRDAMRGLKAKVEEDARLQGVRSIIDRIYNQAVAAAKAKAETSYKMEIPKTQHLQTSPDPHRRQYTILASDPFYIQNMPDILSGLQTLFPDCKVSHTLLSQGTDGKFYDISTLDEKILPFVNRALDQSFIVIDWS
jgi:hypothetical protein